MSVAALGAMAAMQAEQMAFQVATAALQKQQNLVNTLVSFAQSTSKSQQDVGQDAARKMSYGQ